MTDGSNIITFEIILNLPPQDLADDKSTLLTKFYDVICRHQAVK